MHNFDQISMQLLTTKNKIWSNQDFDHSKWPRLINTRPTVSAMVPMSTIANIKSQMKG